MGCEIKRILQFNTGIKFAEVAIINDNNEDYAASCLYAWSTDGVCFTSWVDYSTYLRLASQVEGDFYLRVLITGGIKEVRVGGLPTTCYSVTLYQEDMFLQSFCDNPNLYNPYIGLDCALELQQQLADGVICMLGIPIYYIRTKPDKDTVDYTFKEYLLYSVDTIRQIKLMIPDGTMPSSKPQFSDLDFDWEVDWDVEVGKTQFATAFGDTAFPKNGDFIYIPMMKRMWNVNSAYDEKNEGLMWRSTTWKLGLTKYNDRTNVDKEDYEETINQWLGDTYDDVFGEKEREERERESAAPQTEAPTFTADTTIQVFRSDAIRKTMTLGKIFTPSQQINHGNLIVARNMYNFTDPAATVTYQKGYCGEDGVLSFIITTPAVSTISQTILSIGNIKVTFDTAMNITAGGLTQHLEPSKTYMVILRWSRANFTISLDVLVQNHREDVPVYALQPAMYHFDRTIQGVTGPYENDWRQHKEVGITLSAFPLAITNIRIFNRFMSIEDAIKNSFKYTTDNKDCILNDVARPVDSGEGYPVK